MIDRIGQFIESQGISVRAFELRIGASNGLIRKAIANNTDIQSKWLTAIVDNYPQISSLWLLTGKGEMLRSDAAAPALTTADPNMISVPREMWRIMQDQAASLKVKDEQIDRMISMLEEQMKKEGPAANLYRAAKGAAQG